MAVEPNPDVVFRRLGERMVLVHLKTNDIFELNETSARFWELIAEVRDVRLASDRLAQEFDVDEAQLRREVDAMVGQLSSWRLIEQHDAG